MRKVDQKLIFSPSDLIRFTESEYVTWMDRFHLEFPGKVQPDPPSETDKLLQKKGLAHEAGFLENLRADGRQVCDVSSAGNRYEATFEAMKEGVDVIFQPELKDGDFAGYADFLIRVTGASRLGDYHYEPWDTKLALHPKPYFLVQLSCYADLLTQLQDALPAHIHVVLGNKEVKKFRTEDYLYYYRQLRQALLTQQQNFDPSEPPDFTGLEEFGRWTTHAQSVMEQQDHLCRIANIRTVQIKKLYDAGITTMKELAATPLPRVPRMQESTFAMLKQQARLQIESAGLDKPKYEVIQPHPEGLGLHRLPPASPMDVYFDMEGNPLAEGGLEYLFGVTMLNAGKPEFKDWWAHNNEQEKAAFEQFMDWVYARWQKDPRMHIYHYASYEKTALRRLMGKYGTREKEVDDLLRSEAFVDLFTVVRQGLRVGEPNYSIKNIEHLYRGKRGGDVSTAMDSVVFYQRWVDERDGDDWQTSTILADIRSYNKEDCDSTWQLADWLRDVQRKNNIKWLGKELKKEEESKSPLAQKRSDVAELAQRMLAGIPADPLLQDEPMRMRALLAHLLEFHWREAKPVFWAKFDRAEMSQDELFEDPGCLAGLRRTGTAAVVQPRSNLYEYEFDPAQDTKIDAENDCFYAHDLTESITVESIDTDRGIIRLKRGKAKSVPPNTLSLIKNEFVRADTIAESIKRTAENYIEDGTLPRALEDFLSRRQPRVQGWEKGSLISPKQDLTAGAVDIITRLDNSTLCIQGPPGSGKTYTAARAIVELLRLGKRVGVTSNGHKSIAHIMDKVDVGARTAGVNMQAVKIQNNKKDEHLTSAGIQRMKSKDLFDAGPSGFNLIGGTAWLFSDPQAQQMVDYLFVDEAGQVSVANLVGVSPSTKNMVLIGDQMQLAQPLQGTHPGESGKSVLEYLLGDMQVIPDDFGIFLGKTWRMHPDVCQFISGAVYEDRLHAQPETAKRVLSTASIPRGSCLKTSGIVYLPIMHEGNSQDSEEEADAIKQLVNELLTCSVSRVDGTLRPIQLKDILIVSPYNMQVRRLKQAIPGAQVGSVDKFQGLEESIVVVSMCSSSGDASPRGLEFIFSKNRLNVAISRAQTLAIIVGSPELARTHCKRVEQMELVNLFCRIVD